MRPGVMKGAAIALCVTMVFALMASCGKMKAKETSSSVITTHTVPSWMIGRWKPLRLFMGEPVEDFDMLLTISPMKFEYYYPNCTVSGRLVMSTDTPHYSANFYRMYMDNVNCPMQWDIPTFQGQEDFGKIFAEVDRSYMYRISDKYWEPTWIYIPY